MFKLNLSFYIIILNAAAAQNSQNQSIYAPSRTMNWLLSLQSKVSQPWHYPSLALVIFVVGAALCLLGCLAASLASIPKVPVAYNHRQCL